jgi:hypothetical protein
MLDEFLCFGVGWCRLASQLQTFSKLEVDEVDYYESREIDEYVERDAFQHM